MSEILSTFASTPVIVLGCVLVSSVLYATSRPTSRLPPSPPGIPLLGNALQLPKQFFFLKFLEWHQQLGDVFSINVAGLKMVIVGDARVAADIMDRKAAATSGRSLPPLV